ncbi:type II toxin-antitoxin system RelE/ParE family toxin [bacterium]|nr:type II toxin-antitoxin system RelE/ParE family toxin [bacterium]MBU2461513.1 type II toxin-antitoxin system RelE/ParE family toxin [bacterium]
MGINNRIYKIEFSSKALRDIGKIPEEIKERLKNSLIDLSFNPYLGYKLLGKYKGKMAYDFSFRYRVIYDIDKEKGVIIVYEVWHRQRDYRK